MPTPLSAVSDQLTSNIASIASERITDGPRGAVQDDAREDDAEPEGAAIVPPNNGLRKEVSRMEEIKDLSSCGTSYQHFLSITGLSCRFLPFRLARTRLSCGSVS